MFASEPAFVVAIRHESLAALEAYQQHNAADTAYSAQTQKIAALLSRPQPQELYETLLPQPATGPVGYTLRIKYFPTAGKGPELRHLIEDRIRSPRPGTVGAVLSAQVAPPDGAAFALTVLFSNLASMDQWRAAQAEDPSFQPYVSAVAALTARPNEQEMARVLQPFPAS